MSETPRGWKLLHAQLPPSAIKPLATSVYGVSGLSDVNEGALIRRLFGSEFPWEWIVISQQYLGHEDRVSEKGKEYRVYMAAVHGRLRILDQHGWREFDGSGGSDNRKLDAAFKGAATVAFKNACKWAGLTAELFLDGRAIDLIYSERVRKDPDMVPETVAGLVDRITEVYGDPSEAASASDQEPRDVLASPPLHPPAIHGEVPRGDVGAVSEAAPLGLIGDREKTDGFTHGASSGTLGASPSASPVVPDVEERQPLYALARSLKTPRTAVEVDAKIAKQGLGPVRMELVLAHSRDHGPACIHVSELAGLLALGEKK